MWETPRLLHVAAALAALASLGRTEGVAQERELPRFDRVVLLETTAETSANVDIGDLDGDGLLDVVLAKGRHWPLVDRVLFGDGAGAFPRAHDLGTASDRTYSGRLADLDGDGDLDVVLSNDHPDPKLVYLNDGKGRFEVGSEWGDPKWPTRNASVVDLDGDARPDIVAANRGIGANHVCRNDGKGRFPGPCAAFSAESATTIAAADFDADGDVDLAVPHRDGGQSFVYLNDGRAGFSAARRIAFGPPDATIRVSEAADLDRDGRLDIVASDEQRGVFVYHATAGGFAAAVPIVDRRDGEHAAVPYALALADLDRDGSPDVVVGNIEAPAVVYYNDGTGRSFRAVAFGDAQGDVYGFAIADLDRDGRPDIAVARSGAPNVVYFADRPARAPTP
jgi:hypothetical protein